jgi:hypothetical protein
MVQYILNKWGEPPYFTWKYFYLSHQEFYYLIIIFYKMKMVLNNNFDTFLDILQSINFLFNIYTLVIVFQWK